MDIIEGELNNAISKSSDISSLDKRQNIALKALDISKRVKKYDSEINRIREEINDEVLNETGEEAQPSQKLNIVLNNYFQTMIHLEVKLNSIQNELKTLYSKG